jgi:hypothetical protein
MLAQQRSRFVAVEDKCEVIRTRAVGTERLRAIDVLRIKYRVIGIHDGGTFQHAVAKHFFASDLERRQWRGGPGETRVAQPVRVGEPQAIGAIIGNQRDAVVRLA